MSKKTAVEWLYKRLERMIPRTALYNIDKKQYLKQAKAMEREQIIEAWENGYSSNEGISTYGYSDRYQNTSEKYYNETYKGGEQ